MTKVHTVDKGDKVEKLAVLILIASIHIYDSSTTEIEEHLP